MSDTFRHIFLPYALMKLGDRWYLPVNRHYKPLGHPGGVFADYHEAAVLIQGLTPARAKRIGLTSGPQAYYLYDDSNTPDRSAACWRRYEGIMAKLMRLAVLDKRDAPGRGRARPGFGALSHLEPIGWRD
jgi:hypothetical protein